ncbi:ribonuclease P protein component [Mycoplasma yeatsii]|uniref:ribonuclease P protein component n=1 Tax=Mycoplasma yeatsii TaxID=51365 RepID=UPI0005B23993|nr:ribonuclease P protein component [Mycoplasma yeatsii]AJM72227.1 ribonuclease P protein subunit [Mycoplasma yeatsii GM274B]
MKNKRIIKKNFEFQDIISTKNSIKNLCFVIYYRSNDKGYLRYGISVGKKIGNAVVRNKVKRQIRMLINNNINLFGEKPFDIIILARKPILDIKFETTSNSFKKIINKL